MNHVTSNVDIANRKATAGDINALLRLLPQSSERPDSAQAQMPDNE